MALAAPPANNSKRVKVYELKNNDWYDRGTGFCSGTIHSNATSTPDNPEAHILVVSEEDPERALLETRITKDDGYQKQQETLIVWTEANGIDMALSFQEADGCAAIWEFVNDVQTRLAALAPDDGLSDDLLDPGHPIVLPDPQLGRLDEIEGTIRAAQASPAGRDALAKFVMNPEHMYITKLTPLVDAAEHLQSLVDLHKLCLIMKHLILLNDTSIIEYVVTDQAIMGVVGALEYDPDFPSHRANHRQYLSDSSKFKEVVPIDNPDIRRKIHYTYRLLYLKDVVLARFLDDPTFSVLNSLIFFHQVDIVNYLQSNADYLGKLFAIFESDADPSRKKEAVLFIQNCCAISKSIQAQNRAQLYHNFIQHGLFDIIVFSLRHRDAALRVAGTDILVALIDHDPHMVRNHIFQAIKEKRKPLTDTLIELLLIEVDLGVKSQMADAIKILLDPSASQPPMDGMNHRGQNGEFIKGRPGAQAYQFAPHTEAFISSFYEDSALELFQPLKDLEHRESMAGMSVQDISLYTHLVEVLSFFLRLHSYKSKQFIMEQHLHSRVAQLLSCPQKYMRLTALKWFRACIGLQDEFHNRRLIEHCLFEPILNILYETMPRDNLLNSACLEFFEFILREKVKQVTGHLVDRYRDRFMEITYVETFRNLVLRYESREDEGVNGDDSTFATEEIPNRIANGRPFVGLQEDPDEEAYFNGDDVEDEDDEMVLPVENGPNGIHPAKPLVDYPDDDDDELLASSPETFKDKKSSGTSEEQLTSDSAEDMLESSPPLRGRDRRPVPVEGSPGRQTPPESMKRRREEDDEPGSDVKRRNSSASVGTRMENTTLHESVLHTNGDHVYHDTPQEDDNTNSVLPSQTLRRTKSMKTRNEGSIDLKTGITITPTQVSHVHSEEEGA
ncbi:hypothetical protein AMS68_005582 [Peltaster fructicola]|uniref:Uncharacterized protein n=1 Tax=Peltaster fructicola TaxID=286661 RepID=A0A6H0XZH1_9PEZI|nr:hypothetical protein AMS68_005582 [Peltaster fructicola]